MVKRLSYLHSYGSARFGSDWALLVIISSMYGSWCMLELVVLFSTLFFAGPLLVSVVPGTGSAK